jgi:hypothetical protein
MARYLCIIYQQDDQNPEAYYETNIWVSTGGNWTVSDPKDFKPSGGRWDASDFEGLGGCLCKSGDRRILIFYEFKPYPQNPYRPGKVGRGQGKFLEPLSKVYKRDFYWEIDHVDDN